jgi:predicted choloylglycine hydrolase
MYGCCYWYSSPHPMNSPIITLWNWYFLDIRIPESILLFFKKVLLVKGMKMLSLKFSNEMSLSVLYYVFHANRRYNMVSATVWWAGVCSAFCSNTDFQESAHSGRALLFCSPLTQTLSMKHKTWQLSFA